MSFSSLKKTILDKRTKGIPGSTTPFVLEDILKKGWNILNEDMPMPLMILKKSNMDYNLSTFSKYLTSHNLSIAPHGKTTMAPQIFHEQIKQGAWGITAGTINQVQVMHEYGIKRVLLANQMVGKSHLKTISSLINSDKDFQFYCFVDSVDQFMNMQKGLECISLNNPIKILPEIGAMGGRTGIRYEDDLLSLIKKINEDKSGSFTFSGISTYEGVIPNINKGAAPATNFANKILEIIKKIPTSFYSNLEEFLITGGGSAHFDIIAERFNTLKLDIPVRILLRSGCYVTNDHLAYFSAQEEARKDPLRNWNEKLQPALEAWSYVQSVPESNLAFLTMGKRDIPYDAGLPIPIKRYRPEVGFLDVGESKIFNTNDQHAYVELPNDHDWRVGDMICSGISHPCTAFDKWRFIPVVNDDYDVIDGILTFF